jgi:hypothetical protein|tara:strand:+ start:177 stop:923 length:747 start_codon:yes stop_codon:yes gene_type:complete
MKLFKLALMFIFPSIIIGQNHDCGDRPIKPTRMENQTIKNFKKSANFINYKKNLKEWKHCMSPLEISERDSKRLADQQKEKLERQQNAPINKCGDRPNKPKRPKGTSIDDFRQTPTHIEYRKKLQLWKQCMSPKQITEPIFNKEQKNTEVVESPCGNKPIKPSRKDGMNHEEYKQTSEYKSYRNELKKWKSCEEDFKNSSLWGDCGKKPTKPPRAEGMNHEDYKQLPEFQEYRQTMKNWKQCIDANKN